MPRHFVTCLPPGLNDIETMRKVVSAGSVGHNDYPRWFFMLPVKNDSIEEGQNTI